MAAISFSGSFCVAFLRSSALRFASSCAVLRGPTSPGALRKSRERTLGLQQPFVTSACIAA